jgi:predicted Fe-Mo cluster-binding NifX family protein
MIVAAPVDLDGNIGHSWGKARTVVVATVAQGEITEWESHEVRWDVLHEEGTHGSHHARVFSFLRDNGVQAVVVHQVGDGMRRMLTTAGLDLRDGVYGDARAAILAI